MYAQGEEKRGRLRSPRPWRYFNNDFSSNAKGEAQTEEGVATGGSVVRCARRAWCGPRTATGVSGSHGMICRRSAGRRRRRPVRAVRAPAREPPRGPGGRRSPRLRRERGPRPPLGNRGARAQAVQPGLPSRPRPALASVGPRAVQRRCTWSYAERGRMKLDDEIASTSRVGRSACSRPGT